MMPELSVVITVLNEKENIVPLVKKLRNDLTAIRYEVIFVDDGSTDGTQKTIRAIADRRITLIELRKNYGQSTAMTAGIDHASGRYIVLLDGDMQNDSGDVPMMLDKMKSEDWDVVAGNRKNRMDGMVLRKIPGKAANFIIRQLTDVHIKDYGCTLKLFKKEIADYLGIYGELHRFIPVLAKMQGASIVQVDVKHHSRKFGKSKYGLGRALRVIVDLITMVFFRKYIQKPMHLFGSIGFIMVGIGLSINIYLLFLKFDGENIWANQG